MVADNVHVGASEARESSSLAIGTQLIANIN